MLYKYLLNKKKKKIITCSSGRSPMYALKYSFSKSSSWKSDIMWTAIVLPVREINKINVIKPCNMGLLILLLV